MRKPPPAESRSSRSRPSRRHGPPWPPRLNRAGPGRGRRWLSLGSLLAGLALLLLGFVRPVTAKTDGPAPILELTIDGVINPLAADYFLRGLALAEEQGYQALVLRLNTPGGLDLSMRQMTGAMLNSRLPVIAYVAPVGARAASAGLFVVSAAHVAAMSPSTNIGAAHPVSLGGGESDATMTAKVENDAAATIRAIAARRGRNAEWVEKAVRESVSITADEARDLNVIDLISPDEPTLLQTLDGRVIETAAGRVTLQTAGAAVVPLEMNLFERILDFVSDPNIAYLLMTVGMLGILGELAHPGTLVPGTVGGLALILAFVGLGNLPFNAAGVALILIALLIVLADFFTHGLGLLSLAGLAAFVLGSIILFRPFGATSPAAPALSVEAWLIGFTALLFLAAIGWVLRVVWRTRRAPPAAPDVDQLVGTLALTASALDPRGQVKFHGERWVAVAESPPIAAGQTVEVVRVEGLLLHVRLAAPATAPATARSI